MTVPGHTGMRPSVGLSPTVPQNAAGIRIDPPASEPSAIGTAPAATVAAEPALDPPVFNRGFHGFRVTPVSGEFPVPFQPNSGMVVLPMITTPASSMRSIIGELLSGTYSVLVREPRVAGNPLR